MSDRNPLTAPEASQHQQDPDGGGSTAATMTQGDGDGDGDGSARTSMQVSLSGNFDHYVRRTNSHLRVSFALPPRTPLIPKEVLEPDQQQPGRRHRRQNKENNFEDDGEDVHPNAPGTELNPVFIYPNKIDDLRRFRMLFVGLLLFIVSSTQGLHSLFGTVVMQTVYGYNIHQMTAVYLCGSAFGMFVFPFGCLYDWFGPRVVIALATVITAVGHLCFALMFSGHIENSVANSAIFYAIMSWGCYGLDVAVLPAVLTHMPRDRGQPTGLLKTFSGLGASLISCIFRGFFSGRYDHLMWFLFALTLAFGAIGAWYVQDAPYVVNRWRQRKLTPRRVLKNYLIRNRYMSQLMTKRRYFLVIIVMILLNFYLTIQAVVVAYKATELLSSPAKYRGIAIGAICVAALTTVLLLPFRQIDGLSPQDKEVIARAQAKEAELHRRHDDDRARAYHQRTYDHDPNARRDDDENDGAKQPRFSNQHSPNPDSKEEKFVLMPLEVSTPGADPKRRSPGNQLAKNDGLVVEDLEADGSGRRTRPATVANGQRDGSALSSALNSNDDDDDDVDLSASQRQRRGLNLSFSLGATWRRNQTVSPSRRTMKLHLEEDDLAEETNGSPSPTSSSGSSNKRKKGKSAPSSPAAPAGASPGSAKEEDMGNHHRQHQREPEIQIHVRDGGKKTDGAPAVEAQPSNSEQAAGDATSPLMRGSFAYGPRQRPRKTSQQRLEVSVRDPSTYRAPYFETINICGEVFVTPVYQTTFFNSLTYVDLWLIFYTTFVMWGVGLTMTANWNIQVMTSARWKDLDYKMYILFAAMSGVSTAGGRVSLGIYERILGLAREKCGLDIIPTLGYPIASVGMLLSMILWIALPGDKMLVLAYIIGPFFYGMSTSFTPYVLGTIFDRDIGMHYGFCFLGAAIGQVFFFYLSWFLTYDKEAVMIPMVGRRCIGQRRCMNRAIGIYVAVVFSSIISAWIVHHRYARLVTGNLKHRRVIKHTVQKLLRRSADDLPSRAHPTAPDNETPVTATDDGAAKSKVRGLIGASIKTRHESAGSMPSWHSSEHTVPGRADDSDPPSEDENHEPSHNTSRRNSRPE